MRSVLVAFSGGVDSSYLCLIASDELGQNALCVNGVSPSLSKDQRQNAAAIARDFGFNFTTVATEEMNNPDYTSNPANRCYHCKTELYGKLLAMAADKGIVHVLDGSNADDAGDYRPGMRAAAQNRVRSPLLEVGLTKKEIRTLSKKHGLSTWDKPASPCLSSRIAYGVPVTIERLSRVERGEHFLRSLGFSEFRVRVHDELARIEIAPVELANVLNEKVVGQIADYFLKLGFRYAALDLVGFRSGSMNGVLALSRNTADEENQGLNQSEENGLSDGR